MGLGDEHCGVLGLALWDSGTGTTGFWYWCQNIPWTGTGTFPGLGDPRVKGPKLTLELPQVRLGGVGQVGIGKDDPTQKTWEQVGKHKVGRREGTLRWG